MPRLPRIGPARTTPQRLPTPAVPDMPAATGAGLLSEAAGVAANITRRFLDARRDEGLARLQEAGLKILQGDEENPGFLSTTGREAIDGVQRIEAAIDEEISRIEGDLPSGAREVFLRQAEQARARLLARARSHAAAHAEQAARASWRARLDASAREAMAHGPSAAGEQLIAETREEIIRRSLADGLDETAAAASAAAWESPVRTAVALEILSGQGAEAAAAYLQQHRDAIQPTARARIERAIKAQRDDERLVRTTHELLGPEGDDFAAVFDAIVQGRIAEADSPRVLAYAAQLHSAWRQQRADELTEYGDELYEAFERGGFSLANVPRELKSDPRYMHFHSTLSAIESTSTQQGGAYSPVSDPRVTDMLDKMQPEQLARTSLPLLAPYLSRSDYTHYRTLQRRYRQALETGDFPQTAVTSDMVTEFLGGLGYDRKTVREMDPRALHAAKRALEDAIHARERSLMRKLTPEERAETIDELINTTVFVDPGSGGLLSRLGAIASLIPGFGGRSFFEPSAGVAASRNAGDLGLVGVTTPSGEVPGEPWFVFDTEELRDMPPAAFYGFGEKSFIEIMRGFYEQSGERQPLAAAMKTWALMLAGDPGAQEAFAAARAWWTDIAQVPAKRALIDHARTMLEERGIRPTEQRLRDLASAMADQVPRDQIERMLDSWSR